MKFTSKLTQFRGLCQIIMVVLSLGITLWSTQSDAATVRQPTVVLVHGAFADGSSWSKVITLLEKQNIHVIAVQNPLTSLQADVEVTDHAIAEAKGPVVLVGHSWAGMVITQAGANPKVKSLVYVAAFAPDKGQSVEALEKGMPKPEYQPDIVTDKFGFMHLTTESVEKDFANDLPVSESRILAAVQGPWAVSTLSQPVTVAAWEGKPTWDIVTENDHMIPPLLQEKMASHIHAHEVKVNSSHVVMLSHPVLVAHVISEAVHQLDVTQG